MSSKIIFIPLNCELLIGIRSLLHLCAGQGRGSHCHYIIMGPAPFVGFPNQGPQNFITHTHVCQHRKKLCYQLCFQTVACKHSCAGKCSMFLCGPLQMYKLYVLTIDTRVSGVYQLHLCPELFLSTTCTIFIHACQHRKKLCYLPPWELEYVSINYCPPPSQLDIVRAHENMSA